jgi:TPR repeat protein
MYAKGQGVPQDYAEAVKWSRLAAAQGNDNAQYNLGVAYYHGQSVPQDYAEALKLFRLAAAQGNADAQYNLGVLYTKGQGVPQDYVQAHKWFNLAAANSTAQPDREKAVKACDALATRMTPAQIAEAQKLAREWKKQESTP